MSCVKFFTKFFFYLNSFASLGFFNLLAGLKSLHSVSNSGDMKRFRQKLSASIVLFLAVGSVPTAAYALDVKIFVTPTGGAEVPVWSTSVVQTPSATDPICPQGVLPPCTGSKGKVVSVPIVSQTYPVGATTPLLQVLAGAKGEAKIETNAATIGTSATINNTVNVVGTFRMLVAGQLRIVTSSDFNLRPGTTSTLNGGGTWQALGRGASKCDKNSAGTYVNSLCTITDNTVDSTNYSNDCTLCRSYGFTDTGYVLRKDLATNTWTKPASGVKVTMFSDVEFKPAAGTATKKEPIGSPIGPIEIPEGLLAENGRFYINLQSNEIVPCEPYLEPCANSERKSSTIVFQGMIAQDQVNFPATSTDSATSDFGDLTAKLHKVEVPIDVQPIDPVPYPNNPGFFLPGTNNDWGQSQGSVQVLALSTPSTEEAGVVVPGVDVCSIVPFDGTTPLGFLSVAGSALVPFTSVNPYSVDGVCIGLRFQFDKGAILATIDGITSAEKQETCAASPIATLILQEAVTLQTMYTLAPAQGSGRNASYDPGPDDCAVDGTTVTCQVSAPVTGSQFIKCAVPAGG